MEAVHPRACGERLALGLIGEAAIGSSPRLRGTQITGKPWGVYARFIPAPAGNADHGHRGAEEVAVHPRACGERLHKRLQQRLLHGSSPRLRGTLRSWMLPTACSRFIPAPAGNAPIAPQRSRSGSVHPRACGERVNHRAQPRLNPGSSPRLRGTLSRGNPSLRPPRFIPAPAGNASFLRFPTLPLAVHPRACGERLAKLTQRIGDFGSSPRLRGTHVRVGVDLRIARFIPAPAGNARYPAGARQESSVHPRACGERCREGSGSRSEGGSSPRLRGTL